MGKRKSQSKTYIVGVKVAAEVIIEVAADSYEKAIDDANSMYAETFFKDGTEFIDHDPVSITYIAEKRG